MRFLTRRLETAGFDTFSFGYRSLKDPFDQVAGRLAALIEAERLDGIVAHSLGGIISLRSLAQLTTARGGRLVLLGTPLVGSHVAGRIAGWPLGDRLLGAARGPLTEPLAAVDTGWQVGQLAGSRRLGLGVLAGGYREAGDGSVAVRETRAAFLADHRTLPVSHSGLLLSRRVADLAIRFLRRGRF